MSTIQRLATPLPSQQQGASQATMVEQSRAVAEVHAAIVVAQQCPRNLDRATADMRRSCARPELAERAFYSYRRGGSAVTGPSVHLARELARCFGNFQSGVKELRRDDDARESEMVAWAWDVESNSRTEIGFMVPHRRDKTGGPVDLVDMRDIYENNANQGARRVREAILANLPPWFAEEAKTICHQTLAEGDGKTPLSERVASCIDGFKVMGVSEQQLADRIGQPTAAWTGVDIANLGVLYRSLTRGETTLADEFPQERVTVAEVQRNRPKAGQAPTPPEGVPAQPAQQIEEPPGWEPKGEQS